MNAKKLARMPLDRILNACHIHFACREKYKLSSDSHKAYLHGKLLMRCATVANRGNQRMIKGILKARPTV